MAQRFLRCIFSVVSAVTDETLILTLLMATKTWFTDIIPNNLLHMATKEWVFKLWHH